jgi:flagellar motor switch protein FliN/FliY
VSQVNAVNVEISVLLGRSILPMQQLLRMGRGAVIPLDAKTNDEVWILANKPSPPISARHPVTRAADVYDYIQISDDRIAIRLAGRGDPRRPTSTTTWPAAPGVKVLARICEGRVPA